LADLGPLQPVGLGALVPGFGPSGSTYDLESNIIIAGTQMMQPPPQREREQEPDLMELPEAPQIFNNQEEQPAGGPLFMGSYTFRSREVPPVRQPAASDPARDLQQIQRALIYMGGDGSLLARDTRRTAQAQSLEAAHGSAAAQWARGEANVAAMASGTGSGRWFTNLSPEEERAEELGREERRASLDLLEASRRQSNARAEAARRLSEARARDRPEIRNENSDTDDPDGD